QRPGKFQRDGHEHGFLYTALLSYIPAKSIRFDPLHHLKDKELKKEFCNERFSACVTTRSCSSLVR
ncbi:MAG: hypothetical protein ACK559_32920, partial [bacterium]